MNLNIKSMLALLAAAAVATPLMASEATASKVDLAKGQATATQICAACHTSDGTRGVSANPILQGQHADYLYKQLTEFKAAKRENAIMQGMAAPLSDADMRNVAAFFASKKPVAGNAKSKDLVVLGESIFRGGIADRKVPACAGCHSPTGAGIPSQYPRLAGQHAEYTESQLKAFRDGVRKNNAVMTGVTAKMNDREIKAVADYMAGLH